jgi:zinc D-Ala-D-Ala carboxypeptidase
VTRRGPGPISATTNRWATTLLVSALVLASGCSSNSSPTGSPAAASGSLRPGATSQPAGTTPAPGTTLEPGTTSEPGTTEPGNTPGSGETPTATPQPGDTPIPSDGGSGDGLPACAYKDKAAAGDPDKDWATMVLDTIYRLPSDFVPKHLVSTSQAGMNGGLEVITAVVDDLRAMHEASIAAGAEIAVRWAYRSYGEQAGAFAYWVRTSGRQEALRLSARPGHSEHQLGTTIDFRSADSLKAPWDYPDWATTSPGACMGENAWRFGFVMSYPRDMQSETCYGYEPWHYRYVGRKIAKDVHASGETLRRYLWEHYAANP